MRNSFFALTEMFYTKVYKYQSDFEGKEFVYTGLCDLNGHPNGPIRAIYKTGDVFEGVMTSDGHYNGWGIKY